MHNDLMYIFITETLLNSRNYVAYFIFVQKFTILAGEFSIEGGEMTSTIKLKRSFTADKYKNEIDAMYAETA